MLKRFEQLIPVNGKGWNFFLVAALPVIVEGIHGNKDWRDWTALPFAVLLAGLNATRAFNASPAPTLSPAEPAKPQS